MQVFVEEIASDANNKRGEFFRIAQLPVPRQNSIPGTKVAYFER
jgi:hypothetical protein